jgi:hypothetical protein
MILLSRPSADPLAESGIGMAQKLRSSGAIASLVAATGSDPISRPPVLSNARMVGGVSAPCAISKARPFFATAMPVGA